MKYLVINDFNDINEIDIRHYSLDKGHYLSLSLAKLGHIVYFLTTETDYFQSGVNYINSERIDDIFILRMDYILIPREPMLPAIFSSCSSIANYVATLIADRSGPKIIVKSDSPLWFNNKQLVLGLNNIFGNISSRKIAKQWVINHIDYIGAQNEQFKQIALANKIPASSIVVSGMGVPNKLMDYAQLENPYSSRYEYLVNNHGELNFGLALMPLYYTQNPSCLDKLMRRRKIIIYTGRVKIDSGKLFYNMKNIMAELGDDYELHIFPGTFYTWVDGIITSHSAKDRNSLGYLRDVIFDSSTNVFIHYPYIHSEKYKYLHFADCGIDFSHVRPMDIPYPAGHAKILEYCEIGLPIVCEENISNLFLVERAGNAMVLPFNASDSEYAQGIRYMTKLKIDREYCRKITVENENWDIKASEVISQTS
jgi:hypothetical protein